MFAFWLSAVRVHVHSDDLIKRNNNNNNNKHDKRNNINCRQIALEPIRFSHEILIYTSSKFWNMKEEKDDFLKFRLR